jgi:uncharacterized membrane protein YbhN (UPF0104 family)
MPERLVPRWVSWLVAMVGIGILVAVVARSGVALDSIDLSAVSVAVLLMAQVAYLVTESLRMQSVLQEAAGMKFGPVVMFRIFVMARILNLVVPQSGNVYRIASLKDQYNAPIVETTGGLAAFVWISVTASLVLSTVLTIVSGPESSGGNTVSAAVLAGLTVALIAAPWILLALASRIKSDSSFLTKVQRASTAALEVIKHPQVLIQFLGYWALSLVVIVIMYSTAFSMVGPIPSIATLIAIYALVQATSFVVITPGNIGIQDLGFAAVAVAFGSEPAVGAAAALIVRVSGVAVTALVGLVVVVVSSRSTAD